MSPLVVSVASASLLCTIVISATCETKVSRAMALGQVVCISAYFLFADAGEGENTWLIVTVIFVLPLLVITAGAAALGEWLRGAKRRRPTRDPQE